MSVYALSYYGLLLVSFLLSVWSIKTDRSIGVLTSLIGLSILTEITVYVMYYKLELKPEFYIAYHIYIPFEYSLLSYYFLLHITDVTARRIMQTSIPLFVITSVIISFYKGTHVYPGINLNLEGVLIIIWTTIALFSIKPSGKTSIFHLPIFWVSVGVLVYYSGGFFFNFIYQYLTEGQSEVAKSLNAFINKGLNCFLYISFIVAFICSNRLRKYSMP